VFSLFRKKPKPNSKAQAAQDLAHDMLMTQLNLFGGLSDQQRQRLVTPVAIGCVFGFTDAMLQRAGVTDETEAMAHITMVFVRMFGAEHGGQLFGLCLNLQTDSDFGAGRTMGANDALGWLDSRGDKVPLRLSEYLRKTPG
jgi:hypothetical protein